MNLYNIDLSQLKELHFTNRHLKSINNRNDIINSKILKTQESRIFIMNEFDLQDVNYIVILNSYWIFDIKSSKREEQRTVVTTCDLEIFKEFTSQEDIPDIELMSFEEYFTVKEVTSND